MRSALSILLCALACCGCAAKKSVPPPGGAATRAGSGPAWASLSQTNHPLIVAPETSAPGRVVFVNGSARHVVLSFPLGKMPAPDQRLSLYRHGLKVGEVRTTTWQRENNIVADIIAGEAEVSDEVRGQ